MSGWLNLHVEGEHTNVFTVCKHMIAWECAWPSGWMALCFLWVTLHQVCAGTCKHWGEKSCPWEVKQSKPLSWDSVGSPNQTFHRAAPGTMGTLQLAIWTWGHPVGKCPVARTAIIIALRVVWLCRLAQNSAFELSYVRPVHSPQS